MLDFSDQPYRFFPPRRSPVIALLLGLYNRFRFLPQHKRIVGVHVSGHIERLVNRPRNERLLLTPNHPTHADAEIYVEAVRQIGISTHIMAAYDVFLRSRRNAWIMQRYGCFSVDREGSDPQAMKQALETLAEGRYGLTIFPEGNVYLQNDVVTPFHEGAAFIGLRSARALTGQGARVLAVPVSIKVTYVADVRDQLMMTLHKLADAVQANIDRNAAPLEKVRAVGQAALARNLHQRGIELPEFPTLAVRIQKAGEHLVAGLERKMDLKPRPKDALIDRIRRIRREVHEIRLDPDRAHDHAAAAHWADEAMLAFRIASYSADYVASRPTIDRFGETIEKLAEDIYAQVQPPLAPRLAFVHFGAPIDLSDYLDSFTRRTRAAVRKLTEACEAAVQAGVDDLNNQNPHPGGRLWPPA